MLRINMGSVNAKAGLRSGASISAGVLTGAGSRAEFEAAGATHVLDSIRDLVELVRSAGL
jgi:phosphoglycolate phosphatase-like HAD superfamily hydrolase